MVHKYIINTAKIGKANEINLDTREILADTHVIDNPIEIDAFVKINGSELKRKAAIQIVSGLAQTVSEACGQLGLEIEKAGKIEYREKAASHLIDPLPTVTQNLDKEYRPADSGDPRAKGKKVKEKSKPQGKNTASSEDHAIIQPENVNKFNRSIGNIDWARFSWSPVTGCYGPGGTKENPKICQYPCYVKVMADRFGYSFEPTFHPKRLSAPYNTKVPQSTDPAEQSVFTCSMGDLFGPWVPAEWIMAVLKEIAMAPQWRFILLTKNPARLTKFKFPSNCMVGATVDTQARVKPAEKAFQKVNAQIKFLSCEPLLEPLQFTNLQLFDLVVIGGCTGRQARQPEWSWVISLYNQAHDAGCKVFMKSNLDLNLIKPRELPPID